METTPLKYIIQDSKLNNDAFAIKSSSSISEALYIYCADTYYSSAIESEKLVTGQWNESDREQIREVIFSLTKPGLRNITPVTIYLPRNMRIQLKVYTTNSPLLV